MSEDTKAASKTLNTRWMRQVNWWLLLLIPLTIALFVAHSRLDPKGFQRLQNSLEHPAPYLVALAAVIFAARFIYTRNPLCAILTVLAAAFVIREFHFEWRSGERHFDWTGKGVYVVLVALAVWAVFWRKRLAEPLSDWRHTSWLIVTCAAYVTAQLIARRVFRSIPGEQEIHRSLEECAETTAHLLLIVSSFIGSWRKYKAPKHRPAGEAPLPAFRSGK